MVKALFHHYDVLIHRLLCDPPPSTKPDEIAKYTERGLSIPLTREECEAWLDAPKDQRISEASLQGPPRKRLSAIEPLESEGPAPKRSKRKTS